MTACTRVFAAGLLVLLCACASQPKRPDIAPLPRGSAVDLVVVVPGVETPDAKDAGESVGPGAGVGAGAGAAVGALEGLKSSAQCGSAMLLCAPFFALFGAGAGAVIGGVAGGVDAAIRALPKKRAEEFEQVLIGELQPSHLEQVLRDEFVKQNAGRLRIDRRDWPRVMVGFEAMSLEQFRRDEVMLEMINSVVVEYGPAEGQRTKKVLFKYQSERMEIDAWLANDGQALRAAISDGIAANLRGMNSVLAR